MRDALSFIMENSSSTLFLCAHLHYCHRSPVECPMKYFSLSSCVCVSTYRYETETVSLILRPRLSPVSRVKFVVHNDN